MTFSPAVRRYGLGLARFGALVGCVAITVYIYSIRDQAEALAAYGLPGIFLLSLVANATVILPAPGLALTFAFGQPAEDRVLVVQPRGGGIGDEEL